MRLIDIEPREERIRIRLALDDERNWRYHADMEDGGTRLASWDEQQELDNMARPKGSTNKKNKTGDIQSALEFVSVAITEHTTEHWRGSLQFKGGMMLAYDGIISAGVKTAEDFSACPHYGHFKRAVERAAVEGANFTQLDATKLAVTAGKFKAVIPCLDPSIMPPVEFDANIAPLNDKVREGFETIGSIVKENGQTVVEASLLLSGQSMVACDRVLMMEFWHGNDLPPNMVLPKRFLNAIVATKKKIVGFGWSPEKTITFHFEDESWIKTQLFSSPWPESWPTIMNKGTNLPAGSVADIPEGFFDAVAVVTPFSDDGGVYFAGTAIRSHEAAGVGASYDFNCPPGFSYSGAKLLLMKDRAKQLHFSEEHKAAFFFSNDPPIRSVLAARGHAGRYSPNNEQVAVPQQFQPPTQEPPQEAQGDTLPGAGDSQPGGWSNPFSGDPTEHEDGSAEDGWTPPASDPAEAWKSPAAGGWGATRSDVPMPE